MKPTPFFQPRIGPLYQQGFNGIRTLVLGTAHICLLSCPHKALCCSPQSVAQMDCLCPCYTKFQPSDLMRLSRSNFIEIEAFCNDEAGYPTYSHFTKYMLHRKGALSVEEREDFWNHVAFTNLLQCFANSKMLPSYADSRTLYSSAIGPLADLLGQLQPQLVYVWGREAMIALQNSLHLLPGLQQESLVPEHPTMELALFSYNYKFKAVTLDYIRAYISDHFPQRQICLSAEGSRYNAIPLETAISNALKRGILFFDNGELVLSPQRPELELSSFLNIVRSYYDLRRWDDIGRLFKKYDKSGRPVKDLRKIRRYAPADPESTPKQTEMQRKLFGIKTK